MSDSGPHGPLVVLTAAIFSIQTDTLCNFGRWHYEEYLGETTMNLGQRLRRSCLSKLFLFSILAAVLFSIA